MCVSETTLAGGFLAGNHVLGSNLQRRASTVGLQDVINTATDEVGNENDGTSNHGSIICSAPWQLSELPSNSSMCQIADIVFLSGTDKKDPSVAPLIPESSTGILLDGAAMVMLKIGRRVRLAEGGEDECKREGYGTEGVNL